MSILDHVLACDVERTALLKEAEENPQADKTKMSEEDKIEHEERLKEVIEQLDLIDAADAPSKATQIR